MVGVPKLGRRNGDPAVKYLTIFILLFMACLLPPVGEITDQQRCEVIAIDSGSLAVDGLIVNLDSIPTGIYSTDAERGAYEVGDTITVYSTTDSENNSYYITEGYRRRYGE